MRINCAALAVCGLVGLVTWAGCGHQSGGERWASQRAKYLLPSEPADALGVLDLEESSLSDHEITLVGTVGGVPNPWAEGQAAFVVTDPSLAAEESEDEHHHACGDNCPYCAKKKAAVAPTTGMALIQVVDEQGQVVPIDARQLFNLAPSQTVVVRGRAERDQQGHLVISARGLYIRR